jgi:hypothetical protein
MTRTVHAIAFALATFTTLGTVAGANGLASKQYAAGQRAAQAYELTHLAPQRVEVVGQRTVQRVVIVGHRNA